MLPENSKIMECNKRRFGVICGDFGQKVLLNVHFCFYPCLHFGLLKQIVIFSSGSKFEVTPDFDSLDFCP